MIELEKASFDNLKDFSSGKLWDDVNSPEYAWVDSVQHKRNTIFNIVMTPFDLFSSYPSPDHVSLYLTIINTLYFDAPVKDEL